MRRTHQRQLSARQCAYFGAEATRARQVIVELVRAHQESIALVRILLLTHERAVSHQAAANHARAVAAATPAERRTNERMIEAAMQAEAAHLGQLCAIEKWASHVMQLHGLMAMADELYCNTVRAPWPDRTTTAAATTFDRFHSRGECARRPD